jgi:hypothetical protein
MHLVRTVRRILDDRGTTQVDVVVGKWKFEQTIIERATARPFEGGEILVPQPADVVPDARTLWQRLRLELTGDRSKS